MIPSRTSTELNEVSIIKRAVEKAFDQKPIVQPSLGGSLPDYVWTKILGVPSILVPYANADQANHSPNENLNVENFFQGIMCTCYVMEELGNVYS